MADGRLTRAKSGWADVVLWAVAGAGVGLAVVGAGLALASGLGYRWDGWGLRTAFTLLRWGVYALLAAVVLSAVGCLLAVLRRWPRALAVAVIGLVLGAGAVSVPAAHWWRAGDAPPIHDITTDLEAPPEFVAVLPLREGAPNSAVYGGPEIAAQQRRAYPDLGPALLDLPPERAVERAVAVVEDLGWEIVAVEPAEGRIEATDRTFWFGFADDVVVRVRPENGGSRVDVRSVSRVGVGDLGTNAARIRTFLRRLHAA